MTLKKKRPSVGSAKSGSLEQGSRFAGCGCIWRTIAERLKYRGRLSEGRAIGSGQIEGACKNLIGKRLKQTWAMWKVDRLNRMASICAVRYSEQWKYYWKYGKLLPTKN